MFTKIMESAYIKELKKVEVEKIVKDYMKIVYAEGGVLYIPVAQMDLIQKYAGADAKKPRLNKLGTIQWGKTKSQVKKAVQIVAKDLVELYAVDNSRKDLYMDRILSGRKSLRKCFRSRKRMISFRQ